MAHLHEDETPEESDMDFAVVPKTRRRKKHAALGKH